MDPAVRRVDLVLVPVLALLFDHRQLRGGIECLRDIFVLGVVSEADDAAKRPGGRATIAGVFNRVACELEEPPARDRKGNSQLEATERLVGRNLEQELVWKRKQPGGRGLFGSDRSRFEVAVEIRPVLIVGER